MSPITPSPRPSPGASSRVALAAAAAAARALATATVCAAVLGCDGPSPARADAFDAIDAASRSVTVPAPRAPIDSIVRDPELLAAIRRGRAIVTATRDSLPQYVGNALRCTSCHLDEGRRKGVLSWEGVYARFPQYRAREGRVILIEDRINGCLRRSLAGRALPHDHSAMHDIVAYLASLSYGVPVAPAPPRPAAPGPVRGDSARGRAVYAASCARCHGADGDGGDGGGVPAPPVWGPRSFSIGAGMARPRTAAAFIRAAMPHDRPGTLDPRDALDVATFLSTQPRPDFAPKSRDWPHGGAPADAPYRTRGMQ